MGIAIAICITNCIMYGLIYLFIYFFLLLLLFDSWLFPPNYLSFSIVCCILYFLFFIVVCCTFYFWTRALLDLCWLFCFLRFSQFFISPLVKIDAMEREVLAVDSGVYDLIGINNFCFLLSRRTQSIFTLVWKLFYFIFYAVGLFFSCFMVYPNVKQLGK